MEERQRKQRGSEEPPLPNKKIAEVLREISEMMEILGENPFKVRAYENAARQVENHPTLLVEEIEGLDEKGQIEKLGEIPSIGKGIAERLVELISSGRMDDYEELQKKISPQMLEMLKIPELGPKKVKALQEAGIKSIEALEKAAKEGKLRKLAGFGTKSEENILRGTHLVRAQRERILLDEATEIADALLNALKKSGLSERLEVAGSIRRKKETIRDIDILATSSKPKALMDIFVNLPQVKHVAAHGETKSSVTLQEGLNVDLRVVEENEFASALLYFTGSKEHNVAVRTLAIKKGYKISEYGIFKGEKVIPCREEKDIYAELGLQYIPPELRENRGEIEEAQKKTKRWTKLIRAEDLKGAIHLHTDWSDGVESLEKMIERAERLRFQYLTITDHSQSARYANGLSIDRWRKQHAEIEKLRKKHPKIKILHGGEVDILADGSLDYKDDFLEQFDIVIGAIHSNFKMDRKEMTERILTAFANPKMHILAHPTGRLIQRREPYAIDMEELLKGAKKHKKIVEINAQPLRLDLNDIHCHMAKDIGVAMVISFDAHALDAFEYGIYGAGTARRGWVEVNDVVNALSHEAFVERLKDIEKR